MFKAQHFLIALCFGLGLMQYAQAAVIQASASTSFINRDPDLGRCKGDHFQYYDLGTNSFSDKTVTGGLLVNESNERPENPYKAEVSRYCQYGIAWSDDPITILNEVTASSSVDLKSAEIKLLSTSSTTPANSAGPGTYAEYAHSFGALKEWVFFEKTDTPFSFNIAINLEGDLSGGSSLRAKFLYPGNSHIFDHTYFSSGTSCGVSPFYKGTYTCNESSISKIMNLTFHSKDLMQGGLPDGTTGYIFEFTYALEATAYGDGVAAFNNSSWLNISAPENVKWHTSSGQFLSNPRANIAPPTTKVSSPSGISLLVAGFFLLIMRSAMASRHDAKLKQHIN